MSVNEGAPDYPLTARQTLFWLDEQLYRGIPYHHVLLTLRLTGTLDLSLFRDAYAETVRAFDQFRTVMFERDGEPRQRFRHDLDCDLLELDLRLRPEELTEWVRTRCQRSFDFADRLFEGALLRVGDDEHVFYFCQHHIITDGRSIGLFVADLSARYRGESVAVRASYADYIAFEQAYRGSEKATRDTRYFAAKAAESGPLRLYGRQTNAKTIAIDRSYVEAGEARVTRLMAVLRDPRVRFVDDAVSRFVTFATVLLTFMYRTGEGRSLVIGTPVPNRSAGFHDTGGLFMEQTFLCVEIADAETFATLASKVRRELAACFRHGQHCMSDRGRAHVTLNFLRLPEPDFAGVRCALSLLPAQACGASFSGLTGDTRDRLGVHLIGFEDRSSLEVGFDFHRDTFDPAQQTRMKGHFLAIFDAFLADLSTPLDHVRLTDDAERSELLTRGRGAFAVAPAPDLITHFREIARAQPDAPALVFGAETLNYAELAKRVGQLARRLADLGVTHESRVGIYLGRGGDEPIAMLAALWAEGAYVPLDPSHPNERVRMILEDATPEVLVTRSELVAGLDLPEGVRVLCLDEEEPLLDALTPLPFATRDRSAQLAYVLFTSGSTGRPKGVEIERGAFANFLSSMAHTPGMAASDRMLAVTTITFDIAGLELFLPLWVGASVQVADREIVLDARKLREVLEREPITVMQATPTTWRLLLEAGFTGHARRLRMLCGGEAMSPELASGLLACGEVWNMYGPTETTVWSTLSQLLPSDLNRIHVGRPIDRTSVYVLDPVREAVPEGVVGELCIGGVGLARGYRDRPELTAEKFVTLTGAQEPERIYRTGDLARLLPSGDVECLGRIDHQVKIRGFRIELGEIESCLRKVAGARDVVVNALKTEGEGRLIAYVVGDAAPEALQAAARAALPNYMQPAAYVYLDAFPLNTNGKVDRARLPIPEAQAHTSPHAASDSDAETEDDFEVRIGAAFCEVLGIARIGLDDDFFALGGDSVRAIELRRRLQAAFGVELSLAALFDSPTVRRIKQALGPGAVREEAIAVRLRKGPAERAPLVCVLGVALYQPLAQALSTPRTVYAVHVPYSAHTVAAPSVESAAARYVEVIERAVPEGPLHLGGLCFGGVVAYEIARQLIAKGRDVKTLAVFDALLPRAVHRNLAARARTLVALGKDSPRRMLRELWRMAFNARDEALQRLGPRWVLGAAASNDPEPEEDLRVTGALASAMVHRYDAAVERLSRPVLLFRALTREEPMWWEIDRDHGFRSVADELVVQEVEGSHLGILKQPFVQTVALRLEQAMLDAEQPHAARQNEPSARMATGSD